MSAGRKGPPFSFFPQSFRFRSFLHFIPVPGLVRFLLLSTQFSVFVRDHLSRWSSWKKISHPWERTPMFKKDQRIRRRVGLQAHARTVRSIKEKPDFPKKTLARTRFGLEKRTYDHLLDVRITPVAGSTWFTVSLCPRHFQGLQWGGVLVTIGWSDMR